MSAGLRVLLVEDDAALRTALTRVLTEWSAEVIPAACVAEGLAALEDGPDLVILDVRLPDGSGVQIAEAMAQMNPMPVSIAISGAASADEAFRLRDLGVAGYLPKPLSLDDFTVTIDAVLHAPVELAPELKQLVGRDSFRNVQTQVRRTMVEQALGLSHGNVTPCGRFVESLASSGPTDD